MLLSLSTRKIRRMKSNILPWAIVGVLVVLLFWSLNTESGEPIVVEKHTTDTIVKTRIDTIVVEKPVVKTKKVVEEKIIYVHDTIKVVIPISEYRFFEDGLYDITARGYDVSLSNVTVFPKTEYRTVTNTVETTVYKDTWNLYFGAGIWAFNNQVVPTVNLSLKTPKMWLISLNTGYYNGGLIYGGSINYKILGK